VIEEGKICQAVTIPGRWRKVIANRERIGLRFRPTGFEETASVNAGSFTDEELQVLIEIVQTAK
jgi:hypothetical protein